MSDVTWAEALQQVEHRLALGMTDVYLHTKWDATLDWSKCVDMDTGGGHRLEMATSVVFKFRDKGLEGRWYLEIEGREANGKGYYQVDVPAIQKVMALLPDMVRAKFCAYLLDGADKIEANAANYQAIATNEYGTCSALRTLARPKE
jgi:hypothetical protein